MKCFTDQGLPLRGRDEKENSLRRGDTRWGSHHNYVHSLLKLFLPTCTVLEDICDGLGMSSQRGDAEGTYKTLTSFEFVFILHMMKDILKICHDLCQLLQRKSQDILNAMDLLRSTKVQIQLLRDAGWEQFIENVKLFCDKEEIFYPENFTDNEKDILKIMLTHYKEDITNHPEFKNISMISELCQILVRTGKSTTYPLVDRLIQLVLTLPVSTATVE
ncbi:hypothetical protein LIER_39631 [Lithospermum erythrorhizon]|uniref:Uncharacterized protein n=1 Tax=Lithospermum erythrorhizon TaxID=34254 RepID=A0AAV3QHQ1_LITER